FSAHAELGRDVPELTFTTRHPLLSIDGQMQLGDETTGKAQLKLHRIGPFAALGGVDLDGDANLAATVSLGSKGDSYTLNGTIDGAGSALLSRLLSHGTHIDAAVRRTDAGLFVDRAEIKGTVLTFSGHGTQNDKALDFTYTARVADMSRVAGTLTGNLSSTGNVTGGTDDFAITANANGVLATTGFEQSPVTLIVLAQHLPNAITGTVEAHGRFDAAPLHLSAALDPRGTGHHVALKTLEWRSVRANGDFTVPANFRAVSGHTEFHVAQLADIGLLIGQQLKGAINGTVDIASEGGRDVGRVHANASGLDIQGNRAEALAIDGSVINPFGKPVAALTLKGSGLALGSLHGSADAKVDGGLDALNVSLTGDFKTGADEIPLTAGATLDLDGGKATLAKFETRYRGEPLRLTAPAHITFKNGVSVDRLQLLSDHAEIFASGRITPTLALDAELRNASPDLIRIFVPSLDADGTLSGEAHLTGTLSAPGGTFSARADGFHLRGEASGLPPANVTASGTLRGQTMALTARIDAGERVHLSLDGSVPLQATRPFDLAANGTLDLAVLDPVLTANGRRVRGTVTLNGRFMGTFDDPRAAGTATLAKGSYEDFTQGVRVTNVAATFEAKGDTITISQLDGKAGHGTISGSGTIALWAPGIPLDLSITMKRARPVATDLFTADLNAELKLTGKLSERLQLSGTARIQQGEINIAESFPSDVAVLDVRRSRNAPAPPPPPKPLAIALDLTVTAPNQIYVRGRGLDAEMGGRLVVKGLSTAPLVNGGFTMRRGELNLGGATVKFTSGKITFDGRSLNGSFDPALDFAAENTSASVTAKLAITGHASAPIIALSSTPPQPQDEVLARLLFGQSVSQLSPLQLAQIAQSFAALGGVGGGFNPLGSLRKTLGLDRLAVGSAASGNGATIEVGKNFGRNVYVGAKQDTSGGTQAVVQIDLTRHLKLETTVTAVASAPSTIPTATPQENGSSVGLTYEFEY
ncbi:MAG TPA: translocation/assembly module TamB domain-containing protein, partial [Rhizomicrobium sp.]|nr:translocation/assembly module TamB domain-containing protein [Rhizomicrobium sp.]